MCEREGGQMCARDVREREREGVRERERDCVCHLNSPKMSERVVHEKQLEQRGGGWGREKQSETHT